MFVALTHRILFAGIKLQLANADCAPVVEQRDAFHPPQSSSGLGNSTLSGTLPFMAVTGTRLVPLTADFIRRVTLTKRNDAMKQGGF
jgi:hypothetical protein